MKLPNYAYTKDKDSRIVGLFHGERLSIPPETYEKYVKVANKLEYEEVPVALKVVNIKDVMKSFVECGTYRNLFDQAFQMKKYEGLRGQCIEYLIEYKWEMFGKKRYMYELSLFIA